MKKPPYEADVATQLRKLTADVRRLQRELRAELAHRRAIRDSADEQPSGTREPDPRTVH